MYFTGRGYSVYIYNIILYIGKLIIIPKLCNILLSIYFTA